MIRQGCCWTWECGLAGTPSVAVLSPDYYQITQVEAPQVPAAELRAALRWRLKEFLPYSIEEAVVDGFALPQAPGRSGPAMMLAVSAQARDVGRVAEALSGAGLATEAIDIPELSLRNLAARVPDQAGGVALVALGDSTGLITISQGEDLYLARNLDLGESHLRADAVSAVEHLALELQRSLDYYESQLASSPASRVLLAPFQGDRDVLLERLNEALVVPSFGLDLEQLLECGVDLPMEAPAVLLCAAGAALRARGEAA